MKKRIAIVCSVLLGGAALYGIAAPIYGRYTPEGETERAEQTVEVRQDGKLLYTLTTEDLAQEQRWRIEYEGHYNIVEVTDGEVRVVAADCPDQICVKMGALHPQHGSIICLPHRLEIRYRERDDVDAVAR